MAARFETRSEWLAAHPASPERLTLSLAGIAGRVLDGEDFAFAFGSSSTSSRWLPTMTFAKG